MLKSVVAAVSLLALFASYSYGGQSGDYVGLSSGWLSMRSSTLTDRNGSSATLSYDSAALPVSIFLGHQFGSGLRVEEELFYKKATADSFNYSGTSNKTDSDVRCSGALTNLYYDWYHDVAVMANSPFSPYAIAGIGIANVSMSKGIVHPFNTLKLWNSGSDTVFAYQIGIGMGIIMRKDLLLDISYRYFTASNIHIDQITTDFRNHNTLLGVRYLFR